MHLFVKKQTKRKKKDICHANSTCREHAQVRPEKGDKRDNAVCSLWLDINVLQGLSWERNHLNPTLNIHTLRG